MKLWYEYLLVEFVFKADFDTINFMVSEKGILKKHAYSGLMLNDHKQEKWSEDRQGDLELIAQQVDVNGAGANVLDVERTLKSLNGYHEDILEALQIAQSHQSINRGTGAGNTPSNSGSINEELLRKTIQDCNSAVMNYAEYKRNSGSKSSSKENVCDNLQPHTVLIETAPPPSMMHSMHRPHIMHQQDDDEMPASGLMRIRNLQDLVKQLEHHTNMHMSPSGSEDIRMSEPEADRHYRLDSSAACSESSQGLVHLLYYVIALIIVLLFGEIVMFERANNATAINGPAAYM